VGGIDVPGDAPGGGVGFRIARIDAGSSPPPACCPPLLLLLLAASAAPLVLANAETTGLFSALVNFLPAAAAPGGDWPGCGCACACARLALLFHVGQPAHAEVPPVPSQRPSPGQVPPWCGGCCAGGAWEGEGTAKGEAGGWA
jgi:hypothetical protein